MTEWTPAPWGGAFAADASDLKATGFPTRCPVPDCGATLAAFALPKAALWVARRDADRDVTQWKARCARGHALVIFND